MKRTVFAGLDEVSTQFRDVTRHQENYLVQTDVYRTYFCTALVAFASTVHIQYLHIYLPYGIYIYMYVYMDTLHISTWSRVC